MGRKAKKGDFLDLDDPTEAGPEAAEEPVNAAKPNKKKGKKGKAAAAAEDDNESDDAAAPAPAAPAAPKAGGGKKGKGKKGPASKFDFGSDDDKDMDLAPAAAASDEDDDFVGRPAAKPKGKSKKAAPVKSAFDLLNGDEDEGSDQEQEESEEYEPVAVTKPKGGKNKGKKPAASAFDLLNEDEEQRGDEDEEEEEEEKPAPAKPSKKKDKQGKKDMSSLFAALEEEDGGGGEAAAEEAAEEEEPQPAAKPSKKKDKKGKKDMNSLFAALEEDGAADGDAAADADEEEEEAKPSKKKDKKGKQDMSSLFAALEEDGAAANGDAAEAPAEEKKKKKKKKDMDSLFAALEGDAAPAAADEPAEEEKSSKKKKDKKDKKKDLDSLMASLELDDSSAAAPAAATAERSSSSGKKGKKGGKAADDDDELAAILAELEAPKPPAAAAAPESSKKKKKKGKGGTAAAGDDDDIDALLAEIDGPKAAAADQPAAAEPAVEAEPAAAAEPAAEAEPAAADADEDLEAAAAAGKELTAAQKKKLKKKQKEKEKKAAAAGGAAATAEEAAEGDEAAAVGSKKGKPVKESAAVRRMREQLEARQKAEEEARAAEEARRKAEEEELRRLEEEEQRKQEEKERKKAAAKAKKEELKRQGKLLTGKAKAEAERLAAIRAQLLAAAAEKGLALDEAGEEAEKKPKKVVYTSKKKQLQRKKSESAEAELDAAAAEQQPQEAQQQQPEKPAETAAVAAAAVEAPAEKESEGLDDWEAAADSWEELDKEEEAMPALAKPAGADAKAAAAAEEAEEEEEESSEEEDEDEDEDEDDSDESGSEDESSSEEGSSEYSSSEEESEDSEEERERRIEEARDKRLARLAAAREAADKSVLRSPICCILGHVDVGKTKILDNIRRTNVQDGEAGGITQQIGATFVPADAIEKRTAPLRGNRAFDMKLPGLLVIDTPGHESFTNLRARGSGLCDIAVLIVDLMHGLEQQTIESINMLKMRKTPFIIALNKCDRLYGWKSSPDCAIREAFKRQKEHVMKEFDDRSNQVFLQLNEQGLNVSLYWKNPDPRRYVNVVPTSAITGEGIPDLLQLMVKLTQSMMQDRLTLLDETQCTVLEVKTMEGLGTTVDVVLVNGTLREGDRIVVCGLGGPIVTRIKSLKTPQVMKEMRVKGALVEHKEVQAAMGVKIVAPGLESAVAGTSLYVIGPDDDEEELKDSVMEDMADIFSKVDKSGEGVCVQASTLGSLEALLSFLDSPDVGIAVSGINIGPVHKKDVLRANVMNEKGSKKFAVILAFDVPVSKEAREMANEYNVKIFTADIIYHLFDQFTAYMKQIKSQEQEAARLEAVFPCVLQILPTCVFNKKDPIVVGVEVVEGIAKVGTPLAVPTQTGIELGRIASLELNHKAVDVARAGQSVAMKIEAGNAMEQSRMYGRHFDHNDQLVSKITRESINALKAHFADEMTKDDWRLVVKLKKVWGVQ